MIGGHGLPYQQAYIETNEAITAAVCMSQPRAETLRMDDVANRDMSSTYALLRSEPWCHDGVQ